MIKLNFTNYKWKSKNAAFVNLFLCKKGILITVGVRIKIKASNIFFIETRHKAAGTAIL